MCQAPPLRVKGGAQQTWPLCVAAAVAALAVCLVVEVSLGALIGWTLMAFYLPSYLDGSEYTGERYWPWFAEFCKHYIMHPVPATLECEEPLDASKQYIFCTHPHGIMCVHHGHIMAGSSKPSFHDISPMHTRNDLAASVVFRIPFYREYLIWQGCVDASRPMAEQVLRLGKSLVIVVGGIAEQVLAQRGEQTVYVKRRKGHIRLALKYGVPIVPSYSFGETDTFTHSKRWLKLRQQMSKKLSMALVLFYGANKLWPLAPHEGSEVNIVFGRPIPVERKENPSAADIDRLHALYVEELVRIYNKFKAKYGFDDHKLHVTEKDKMATTCLPVGKQVTWPYCVTGSVAALAVAIGLGLSIRATIAWTLLAFYLPSYLDGAEYTGERYWHGFVVLCRRFMTSIPTTLECEETIDPEKQYIFCSHPHGILSAHHGALMAGSSVPSFHDVSPLHTRNDLGASVIFRIPFYREYCLWQGCVEASRPTAEKMLKKGKSLVILVGGIAEQMISQRGDHTIYVQKRKGHIRLALKYGVPIVPAYAFASF
ncbi:hypothetical protein ATCC90586_012050 [Pythium insidiosum]|nr:hypothetical protein ATCC90586_012050 [Pythium insidiosum]